MSDRLYLGIDGGKTAFKLGIFSAAGLALETSRVTTESPLPTLKRVTEVRDAMLARHAVEAVGISMFGPLDADVSSPDYGSLRRSSRPDWSGVNAIRTLSEGIGLPTYFFHDVVAGAFAEHTLDPVPQPGTLFYLAIGTGIGGHYVDLGPRTWSGRSGQVGHLYLPKEIDDQFVGACPFHGCCFQGLASGRAIAERWQVPGEHLPEHHPAWDLQARYVARASANIVYAFGPTMIRVGSGVSKAPGWLVAADRYLEQFLGDFRTESIAARPRLEATRLGPDSALVGAALLAAAGHGLPGP